MADFIVVAILVVILGAAVRYIYKAKKSGAGCIGCPASSSCGAKGGCACCGGGKGSDTCKQEASDGCCSVSAEE